MTQGIETGDPAAMAEAHGGDFYVEPNCCLLCGVPEDIAPEIFETGEVRCFVKRQPRSSDEVDRTVRAMWSSEVNCIRYRGRDPCMLERLARAGMAAQADCPSAQASPNRLRNKVSFAIDVETNLVASASLIASSFRDDMRAEGKTVAQTIGAQKTVRVSWFQNKFHRVRFSEQAGGGRFVARLSSRNALQGLSWLVDDWLRSKHAAGITWYLEGDTNSASPTPM